MRLLHMAFIVALASGFAAILIYITGVSNLMDGTFNISDKEIESLQSFQTGFQKCVIKSLGAKAEVVLNPGTPLSTIEYVLDVVDLVLIMSVNPGFGGQSFIESQVKKISDLRRMCGEGVNPWIEVDGGAGPNNAYKVIEAGANALVAGSAVFGAKDYAEAIKGIKTSTRPVAVPA